jgi:hypothetical protein
MKLKYLSDFFVYRITKLYEKPDKGETFRGAIIVGGMQATIIFDLVLYPLRLIYSRQEISLYLDYLNPIAVFVAVSLMVFNYLRYRGSYEQLRKKFQNESSAGIPTILIILGLLSPLILLITLGVYR